MLRRLFAAALFAGAATIVGTPSQPATAADYTYGCNSRCGCRGCPPRRPRAVWAPRRVYVVPAPVVVSPPPIIVVAPMPVYRELPGPYWRGDWYGPAWRGDGWRDYGWYGRGWHDAGWRGHGHWNGGWRRW